MKMVIAVALVLLSASSVFAARDCSSLGGTCRYSCQATEFRKEGFFRDCDNYKQACCLTENPAAEEKPQRDTPMRVPETRKTAPATEGAAAQTAVSGKSEESLSGTVNQILVCSPVNDVYANADTLLKCGDRNTTLDALYGENYRLIQIVNSSKVLYYLERKALR